MGPFCREAFVLSLQISQGRAEQTIRERAAVVGRAHDPVAQRVAGAKGSWQP